MWRDFLQFALDRVSQWKLSKEARVSLAHRLRTDAERLWSRAQDLQNQIPNIHHRVRRWKAKRKYWALMRKHDRMLARARFFEARAK